MDPKKLKEEVGKIRLTTDSYTILVIDDDPNAQDNEKVSIEKKI